MAFLHNFSFILFLIEINAEVSLKMDIDTNSFGNYIVLTCTVHGIQTIDITTTRQWSMGDNDELLCYNGRINNRRKYTEKVLTGNEFSLSIFNVTESDLNVVYQCRYGFDAANKFIEADEQKTYLSLRLVKDSIIFGGDMILTCAVNGLNSVDRDVTRQWSMGNNDELLSYNGRINNHKKYEETVLPRNEFRLKIINVTEADVNVTYRCRYGFDTATYFIQINNSVSLHKTVPSNHSFNISSHNAEIKNDEGNLKRNATISFKEQLETKTTVLLLAILIPLAIFVVAVAVILIVKIKRKHQRQGTKKNNKNENQFSENEKCLQMTEEKSLGNKVHS